MTDPYKSSPEPVVADAIPQNITTPLSTAAIFLVAMVDEGGESAVRELLPDIAALRRAITFRRPDSGIKIVAGIGADVWPRLFNAPMPHELHPFIELDGDRHRAPSTEGDVLFHIQASTIGVCFELADQIMSRLSGAVTAVEEVHGFQYFDRRNLLGFVDGTENPEGTEAVEAVYIDSEPDHTGGSYVIVQKYIHDMDAWNSVSVEEQQRVVGRTKLDDIEFGDDTQASNSHVALTDISDDDGNDLDIYRANMPFGSAGSREHGTFFIGYAKRADTLEQMLRNMFIGDPPGNSDRLLDFSTAQTGSLFFAPSQDFLDDPPPAPVSTATTAEADEEETSPTNPDGSLGIGSLNRSTR
ncbi:MAG: Dyp-type peroxidase [Tomitella sp.]|nr:Dyp-type peroxidase [Tomitella sp.]